MPSKQALKKAEEDLQEGKSPSTAAGEFVKEEIDKIREGEHGARSTEQAIAIGLSEARRAGIPLKPQKGGKARSYKSEEYAYEEGQGKRKAKKSRKRSAAV